VGELVVPSGGEVTLEIGVAGLPFGAGPHRCPGDLVRVGKT
jgi:cytochrome P450